MKLIELEERKQIQMQILDAVDKFCLSHDIRYSLACGSLIGAVRHGGFIPWDDDIDIHMLREDYVKFEKEFPEILDRKYKLMSLHRNANWPNLFAKVYDDRTIVKEKIIKCEPLGINIDIFPVDEVPDEEHTWQEFNKKRWNDLEKTRHYFRAITMHRPIWENIAIALLRFRYIGFNPHAFGIEREKYAMQYNGKGFQRVYITSYGQIGKPFPKKLFNELIDIPFEDRHYKAFKDYDTYLSAIFGDYMTPPPPEKRISFHTYDTYWKES